MSDIHIYLEREQPVKVITLEPTGARGPVGPQGPAGPAGPNSVTSATTSDGTAELSLASLEAGSRLGLVIKNNNAETLFTIGKDNSVDGESGSITGLQIGFNTVASAEYSFAHGAGTTASGGYSHAEGSNTIASGAYSHASGVETTASGVASYATGEFSVASGNYSFAIGSNTTASGLISFAGGVTSTASGDYSYAYGTNAKAIHDGASVESDSQAADVESTTTDEKTFRFANGYRFLGGSAYFEGTVLANHIHGNLAGSVYAHIRAGEELAKGDPVYISGSHGTAPNLIPIVSKADASNPAKMPAMGIMDAALANNANGHMVITGTIADLNTAAYAVNDTLYVASGGGLTATPPTANSQPVARVERSNANNGALIVKVNGLASNGGNGVSDANKLVRFSSTGTIPVASIGGLGTGVATALAVNTGSAGAFVVNGGTATNMTFAGTAAFTSTTRPTSAGTGAPAATSLITTTDILSENNQDVWNPITFAQSSTSGSGASATNYFSGGILTLNNTSTNAYSLLTTGDSMAPFIRNGSGTGYALNIGSPEYSLIISHSPTGYGTTEFRVIIGASSTTTATLAAAGLGIVFAINAGVRSVKLQYHNGTTLTESSFVADGSSLSTNDLWMATYSKANGLRLWRKQSLFNNVPPRWSLLVSLACPSPPDYTAGTMLNFVRFTTASDASNRSTVLRFAKMLNKEITPLT